jgi:electron transport complex protein RnfA
MLSLSTLLSAALVNNVVLTQFLGLCPIMGVSKKISSAVGMSCATIFVLTLTATISFLLEKYLLQPFDLGYLRIIVFIVTIAAIVQGIELFMRASSPLLYAALGLYLPLITTNCAVLGVALLNVQSQVTLMEASLYGLGAGIGFAIVLILFASLRERIALSAVPKPFQGASIGLITAGLMALAFMGFNGWK